MLTPLPLMLIGRSCTCTWLTKNCNGAKPHGRLRRKNSRVECWQSIRRWYRAVAWGRSRGKAGNKLAADPTPQLLFRHYGLFDDLLGCAANDVVAHFFRHAVPSRGHADGISYWLFVL